MNAKKNILCIPNNNAARLQFGLIPCSVNQMTNQNINNQLIKIECHMDTEINTLRPRQNGRHFADSIFKCIFLNENVSIAIKISLKFVPMDPINNIQHWFR